MPREGVSLEAEEVVVNGGVAIVTVKGRVGRGDGERRPRKQAKAEAESSSRIEEEPVKWPVPIARDESAATITIDGDGGISGDAQASLVSENPTIRAGSASTLLVREGSLNDTDQEGWDDDADLEVFLKSAATSAKWLASVERQYPINGHGVGSFYVSNVIRGHLIADSYRVPVVPGRVSGTYDGLPRALGGHYAEFMTSMKVKVTVHESFVSKQERYWLETGKNFMTEEDLVAAGLLPAKEDIQSRADSPLQLEETTPVEEPVVVPSPVSSQGPTRSGRIPRHFRITGGLKRGDAAATGKTDESTDDTSREEAAQAEEAAAGGSQGGNGGGGGSRTRACACPGYCQSTR